MNIYGKFHVEFRAEDGVCRARRYSFLVSELPNMCRLERQSVKTSDLRF